ncbi:TIGR03557 family F420-dependent LLM class oxidoreductase [Jiangella anatolica]|uniref:LLM class F420-dependent oxidoreductase n=1 Tax=Jiangella anatolica TaxID=2670374 RepID=A0A2W2B7C0_9ACTN|nr:TIGR03557 family F420-dependent LLM class oxidoreductase [Jiangella anatolica]PZF83361.1 LLM class F420-dependent oxidoreductase [Jiangella anatolica]
MTFGYFLASEDWAPRELIRQAVRAQEAGFEALWISDHFHPWTDQQGQSPFVWSVIGALSRETDLPITTAVTCPTVRIHPAVIAQAAATVAVLHGGRFVLGVGTGEALNEQVTGAPWPLAETRLAMLEEAVAVMRELWTGEVVTRAGEHYRVEHARIYTRPDTPPPVYVSAFAPGAAELAGRIGDGLISTIPDAGLVAAFHRAGGAGKPVQGGVKVCYGADADEAAATAHRFWPNAGLPGELGQVLRTPEHVMQASSMVTPEQIGDSHACGPDADRHVQAISAYLDAGYGDVFVNQIGPDQDAFFDFYAAEVLPRLKERPGP